jgi:hypothetical protein
MVAVIAAIWSNAAIAQDVAIPGPNMKATLEAIGSATGSAPLGDALALGTILEIATAPLATGASGLTFVYDPTVGTYTRLAETFGPAFAQRALTSGRRKFTLGVSWNYVKFDEIAGEDLDGFVPFTSTGFVNVVPTHVDLGLDVKTSTVSVFSTLGLTDRIDVGVLVPITAVSLASDLEQTLPLGPPQSASSDQSAAGLADLLIQGKVQLWHSERTAGSSAAPAWALATVVGLRLPTGSEDDLRGLGFARTKISAVVSAHAPRFAAHANVGYEFWADQLSFASDLLEETFVETKGMIEVNAVAEVAVTPRLTANFDVLVQQIRGAGKLGMGTLTLSPFPGFPGLTAQSLVGLDEGLTKYTVAPGIRWNVGSNALLNAHVLFNVRNDGLRAKITPVIGLDYTF